MLEWSLVPGTEIRIARTRLSSHELFRVVPASQARAQARARAGGRPRSRPPRSWQLERRDGAFWWPLLGSEMRHGVPRVRTWRSAVDAMVAAEELARRVSRQVA